MVVDEIKTVIAKLSKEEIEILTKALEVIKELSHELDKVEVDKIEMNKEESDLLYSIWDYLCYVIGYKIKK